MKTIEITYDPYRMLTEVFINKVDVCQNRSYEKFKGFIKNKIPLQTWIEPIKYLDWAGFVNEVSDPEFNDEVTIIFSGRVIDYEDLKRSIADQNEDRPEETRVVYKFQHKKVFDDKVMSQNIEDVVEELKSERFQELVSQITRQNLTQRYNNLEKNYKTAKDNRFQIVLAGAYSSGKSTLLNALIRHDILPTSSRTCTSKNCRIRHDSSLGEKISLAVYGELNEQSGKETIIREKMIYDTDEECAAAFLEICPIKEKDNEEKYPKVETMELGVDLSHLYPDSVSEDKFTIELIDTPGMDSAQSSEDGTNKHAEIALEAISMESKPMIILCADASYYDNKSIGEFMREIIIQSKEDSGFNDRFLFLMNKSDAISYKRGENAESAKMTFAEYLTDSSKWNIKGDENEIKQLAENASHFVPRVFMTASLIAFAIQKGAIDFTDEELEDPYNEDLYNKLNNFIEKICGRRKRPNYYLSRYCDIPNYRKDELEQAFEEALNDRDDIRAAELQCGLASVESAIRDYIARYAYPIKVRDLLDTFEAILIDIYGFYSGTLYDLQMAKEGKGILNTQKKYESEKKGGVEEKLVVFKNAKEEIEIQKQQLEKITFNSESLREAIGDFKADITSDDEYIFIREHPKVSTGQKTHSEVENEIKTRIANIQHLFDRALCKINKKLDDIEKIHYGQINSVFDFLNLSVAKLESSGVFNQGKYNFTNSVLWKMKFSNLNFDRFAADMKKNIVDSFSKEEQVPNVKKNEWRSSWNPFKKIRSFFMDDYKTVTKIVDGYYETIILKVAIDGYFFDLQKQCDESEKFYVKSLEQSIEYVKALINELDNEVESFYNDIMRCRKRIDKLGDNIDEINKEIELYEDTLGWLDDLKEKIKEV